MSEQFSRIRIPSSFLTVWEQLYSFIKHPKDYPADLKPIDRLKTIGILFLFEIIFTVLVVFPIALLVDSALDLRHIRSESYDYSQTLLYTFLVLVILIPVVEEGLFRYPLRYSGLCAAVFEEERWAKLFPYFVYTSAIAFGLVHISNYSNDGKWFYLLSPLLVLSQLFGGFVLSFIRVRLGFRYAVLMHTFWNLIFILLLPLISSYIQRPLEKNTDQYQLNIKTFPFYDTDRGRSLSIEKQGDQLLHIDAKQYLFQEILDTLYGKENYFIDGVFADIRLRSEKGISRDSLLRLLEDEYAVKKAKLKRAPEQKPVTIQEKHEQ